MTSGIRIAIPVTGADEANVLREFFQARLNTLSDALDLGVSEFDRKAQINHIEVSGVEVLQDAVEITYRLFFSASDTCSGIEYSGAHQRSVRGLRHGDAWFFQKFQPLPKRSTADEL